jgi:AbrB family looped-hinge helix DNA binding protein
MAMALAKVQSRGQITLPREVRQATGIRAGDTVIFQTTENGTIELRILHHLSLRELLDKWSVDEAVDVEALRREAQEAEAQRVIARLND